MKIDQRVINYDDAVEKLSKNDRLERLEKKLKGTIRFAYEKVSAVKNILECNGLTPDSIQTIEDLQKIPVMKKEKFLKNQRSKPPFGDFLNAEISDLKRVYISPGPIYDIHDERSTLAMARHLYRDLDIGPGNIAMISATYHMVPAGVLLTECMDLLGITVIPAGTGQSELQIKIMRELGVTGFYGFPSFLMTLINKAEKMGYDIKRDFNLKWASASGERHGQIVRKKFEEDYGIRTTQEYGNAQLGWVAFECKEKNGMHCSDDNLFVEICDPETGEQCKPDQVGEIVVTRLDNILPLIRFGTGDLASFNDTPCPCGRTTQRISNIVGMVGDHIRVKGMFIHKREVQTAVSLHAEISKVQIVIELFDHRDMLTFKIEPTDDSVIGNINFKEEFVRNCKELFKIKPDKIEFVPRGSLPDNDEIFLDKRW